MPETILQRAITGLGNALGLGGGGRIGPAGIEFSLPAQPVADVGAYARYGSGATRLPDADGWALVSVQTVGGGIGFTTASLVVGPTAIPAMRPGDVLWIYRTGVHLLASVDIADYRRCVVDVLFPSNLLGVGNVGRLPLFQGVADQTTLFAAAEGWAAPTTAPESSVVPFPIPQGGELRIGLQQDAAAGIVTATAQCLARILPAGVLG